MAGTKYTLASFPVGEKIGAASEAITEYSKQLGCEVEGARGLVYRLVRLNNASGLTAAAAAKRYFEYTSNNNTYDVNVCASAADIISGVGVPTQEELDDNDLFWLQVDGKHLVTDSGSGVSADENLEAAAGGEAATATVLIGELATGAVNSRAVATAAADADITAVFLRKCP